MIRNVVLVKLKSGQDSAEVADIQNDFRRLDCPGMLSYTIGSDLGLREGNWSFAIVADFTDADTYRAYDQDPAHNKARARLAPSPSKSPGHSSRFPARSDQSHGPPYGPGDWRIGIAVSAQLLTTT